MESCKPDYKSCEQHPCTSLINDNDRDICLVLLKNLHNICSNERLFGSVLCLCMSFSSVCFSSGALGSDFAPLVATNQRVVAAQRQQRGLVAVTIRGSVLFYSSAI